MSKVLVVDKGGNPRDWVSYEDAVCYHVRGKVIWEIGEKLCEFRGGRNAHGEISRVAVSSIIGVTGPLMGDDFYNRELVHVDRMIMYARDRHLCAYCGLVFSDRDLTIDHVLPSSRGGKNTWVNCVTACTRCNSRKGNNTPEEADMPLLYVPYAVNKFERMILSNRKILADQMDFLISRVPRHSRLFQ